MTDLVGATVPARPETPTVTAGEFAARWNRMNDAQRQAWVDQLQASARRNEACILRDHEGALADMTRRLSESSDIVSRLLQKIQRVRDWSASYRRQGPDEAWMADHVLQVMDGDNS